MNADFSGQTQATAPLGRQEPLFFVEAKLCDEEVDIPDDEV